MNIVAFTEFLVKELVTKTDLVSVKEFEEDEYKVIQVLVSADDISKVIGKEGRIANAIRTIMKALAAKEDKKISIEFIG